MVSFSASFYVCVNAQQESEQYYSQIVYNGNRDSCTTCCAVYNRNMPCRKEQDLVVFMCDINVGWSFGVDIVGMETCMFIMAT